MLAKCVLQVTNKLNLPISRSLVRAHGGDLWVESKPGEGSTFYFTLPIGKTNNEVKS